MSGEEWNHSATLAAPRIILAASGDSAREGLKEVLRRHGVAKPIAPEVVGDEEHSHSVMELDAAWLRANLRYNFPQSHIPTPTDLPEQGGTSGCDMNAVNPVTAVNGALRPTDSCASTNGGTNVAMPTPSVSA